MIECKNTGGRNIRLKEQAWENLLAEFNSHAYVTKHNIKQLKSFYDNYSMPAKRWRV